MPSPTLARALTRLRPPFAVTLVGLVVLITAATAVTIGSLAWREQRERSRTIVDTAMAQTARLAAAHTQQFLSEAQSIARLGPQLVAEGHHTGVVVAGNIGSKEHVKYGAVGPAVNLASRVQSLAHGGQVLLTNAALARVRGSVRVGPAVRTRVKGVTEPVVVQPLLAMLDAETPAAAEAEPALVAS
jgi:class 3 adenylate cyclase